MIDRAKKNAERARGDLKNKHKNGDLRGKLQKTIFGALAGRLEPVPLCNSLSLP